MAAPVHSGMAHRAAGAQLGISPSTRTGYFAVDVSTAKTLVSALLVSAIVIFTIVSLQMFASALIRDLKDAGTRRVGGSNDRPE